MATRKSAKQTARKPARKAPAKKSAQPARRAAAAPAKKQVSVPDRRQRTPETLRVRSIAPSITADDLARSTKFYTEVLGFLVSERWTDSTGALRGVMLKAGACEIGLSQDDWAKGRNRMKGLGMSLWCETGQDIDQLAARIKSAGGMLSAEPKTQAWGGRSLSVRDPDGIQITFFREE